MRKAFFCVFLLLPGFVLQSQQLIKLENRVNPTEIQAHLEFLAADEMQGRSAGSRELDIAANYIRAQYKIHGLEPIAGALDYFQPVRLVKRYPVPGAKATVGTHQFSLKKDLILFEGDSLDWNGELLYIGYGMPEDVEGIDVKGKFLLALAGSREANSLRDFFSVSNEKGKWAQEAGASGLLEIFAFPQAPWPSLVNAFSNLRWGIERSGVVMPHAWVKPENINELDFRAGQIINGSLQVGKRRIEPVNSKNVVGLIEGTDPKLKGQFVIVTAHYDHIGTQPSINGQDSIFNGARDNAIGTVALIQTAKVLVQNQPKRSVLLIALTSEEKGLLGSQWYTEHPLVPLSSTVLSINCDGVGYNDKSILTSISWGKTSTDETVKKAAQAYGLGVGGDPDPREGFFERSDQVSFARKGVVAIKLQPGLARMDDEIRKYYHRQADEVSSLDIQYLTKFYKAFVQTVNLLANETKKPAYMAGDKYEKISKELYSEK